MPVTEKKQMDIIWMVWDGIIQEGMKRNKLICKILNSLLHIFCIRYTNNVKKKRRYIIYFAISLLTENINMNINIHNNDNLLKGIRKNINKIYKQVKINEVSPETDYLFNAMEKQSNLEKTIAKIDIINNIGLLPIKN
jgi:hypothetical protein